MRYKLDGSKEMRAFAHRVLWKAVDEKERWTLSSIAEVNIDVFQGNSLMFPVIKRDDLSLCLQPEGANKDEEFNKLHGFP